MQCFITLTKEAATKVFTMCLDSEALDYKCLYNVSFSQDIHPLCV